VIDIRAHIETLYDQGSRVLVFPSEIAAAMWRRALLKPHRRAIDGERLVSWDRFKQQLPGVRRDRRPASRVTRLVFAYGLIEETAGRSDFQILFNSEYPESAGASVSAIARLLPRIPSLLSPTDTLRPELVREYRAILDRYRAWLERYRLFEADWEDPPALEGTRLPGRPVIVWPELIEDFPEYESWIRENGETVPLAEAGNPSPASSSGAPPVRIFENYHQEIRAVFSDIEGDLERNIPLHEIALTLADLDAMRPWIELESRRRSIPVRFAGGRPVAESAGARWLLRMDDLVASDFSVVTLATVLLDRSVPWRSRRFLEQLIEFGYRSHAYCTADWTEAFALAERLPEGTWIGDIGIRPRAVRGWRERFGRLRRGILAIVGASSAAELAGKITAFARAHLEPPESERWRPDGDDGAERVFSIAQAEAAQLVHLESYGIPVLQPWAIYRDLLRERLYVPQGSTGSVAVYPYRVAAGIPAQRHYVLNLAQNATRVKPVRPLGPRTEELRGMHWNERDRSAAFLRAYGLFGDRGAWSCAVEGPAGAQVVASEILARQDVDPRRRSVPPEDRRSAEDRWWREGRHRPTRMYRSQYRGLVNARSVALADPGPDYQREPVAPDLVAEIPLDPLSLSPTTIRQFSTCSFSYLLGTVLSIDRRDYGYLPENRRVLGTALHRAMELLLTETGINDPAQAVSRALSDPTVRIQMPRRAETERCRWYEAVARLILQDEELAIDAPGESELKLSWDRQGARMTGKADRVTGLEDGPLSIVDFKLTSGSIPTQAQVAAGKELQIPLYALMLRERYGRAVDRVGYVDLSDGAVRWIARREGSSGQRRTAAAVDELIENLPDRIDAIRRRIKAGDFRCDDENDCSRCGMRSICRRCYVTRRYRDAP